MGKDVLEVSEYLGAAFLKAKGIRFLGGAPGPGARVRLRFADPDGAAAKLLEAHTNGGVNVNSAKFAAAIRDIKDSIFSLKGTSHERR